MAGKGNEVAIEIRPLDIRTVTLRLIGDTPLIMHAWSEKAKRQMLEAQMGKSKGKKKEAKSPVADFVHSMYWLTPVPNMDAVDSDEEREELFFDAIQKGARFGFPVTAIKQAAISSGYRRGDTKDKVSLRGAFFIKGDADGMVEIKSDVPVMREDMVRVGMGTADIRYRGEFRNWTADLEVQYDAAGQYSLENIINLINQGGFLCGIGEWRPEKGGEYGRYHVDMQQGR